MYINVFPKRDRTVIAILVDFSVPTWEVGLRNSPYEIRMLEDMTCKVVCKQALPGPRTWNWGILGTWDAKLCCNASTPEVTPEIGESFLTVVARLVDFEQSFDGGTVYIQTIDGFSERIIAAHWDFSYFIYFFVCLMWTKAEPKPSRGSTTLPRYGVSDPGSMS